MNGRTGHAVNLILGHGGIINVTSRISMDYITITEIFLTSVQICKECIGNLISKQQQYSKVLK